MLQAIRKKNLKPTQFIALDNFYSCKEYDVDNAEEISLILV